MLDPPAARAFLADLEQAAGDRGVLVITHQHDHLQAFDRVLDTQGRPPARTNTRLMSIAWGQP